jgi:hypothetical protein
MTDDLSEILARLDYTKTQIDALQGSLTAYVHDAVHYWVDDKSELPWHKVMARMTKPFPVSIASQVGQITNEIRSCLDALVTTLAVRNGRTPSSIRWPICETEDLFKEKAAKQIYKLSDPDKRTILGLNTHGDHNPRLYAFHALDITKKHKPKLGLKGLGQSGYGVRKSSGGIRVSQIGRLLELGKDTLISASIPEGEEEFSIYTDAVFLEPEALAGWRIIDGLRWFNSEVRNIVMMFA